MSAYLAPSLERCRAEINVRWPGRSKKSDGWIGDVRHMRQGDKSEHNPDPFPNGVVRAIDVTSTNIDGMALVLAAIAHPSCYYVIHRGSIWSRPYGFRRRRYTGSNSHTEHVHISIVHTGAAEGSTLPWLNRSLTGSALTAAVTPSNLHAPTPPADFEETLMAKLTDPVINSKVLTDNGKKVSVEEILQYLMAQSEQQSLTIIELYAELREAKDGRLGHDLRWSHTWLRNSFASLGKHFALPGDQNLPEDQRALGGRVYRSVVALLVALPEAPSKRDAT